MKLIEFFLLLKTLRVAVMKSFFTIKSFKSLKKLMDSFFSVKKLKSRKKLMDSFSSIKNFKSYKKVTNSLFEYKGAYKGNFKPKKYHIETFLMI